MINHIIIAFIDAAPIGTVAHSLFRSLIAKIAGDDIQGPVDLLLNQALHIEAGSGEGAIWLIGAVQAALCLASLDRFGLLTKLHLRAKRGDLHTALPNHIA